MDTAARLTARRFPRWTLAICASVVLIFCLPSVAGILIYDRAAIADGEFWRLVSGNLVHYSAAHLGYDLLALLVAGTMIETSRYRYFPLLCVAAAAFIGMVLYWAEPAMRQYAGLSGVATAAMMYLCLHGLTEKGAWRWVCAAALLALGIKAGFEITFNASVLSSAGSGEFLPAPLSHLVGAGVAVLLFVFSQLNVRNYRRSGGCTKPLLKPRPS